MPAPPVSETPVAPTVTVPRNLADCAGVAPVIFGAVVSTVVTAVAARTSPNAVKSGVTVCLAVLVRLFCSDHTVAPGLRDFTSAAMPDTRGADAEVPQKYP